MFTNQGKSCVTLSGLDILSNKRPQLNNTLQHISYTELFIMQKSKLSKNYCFTSVCLILHQLNQSHVYLIVAKRTKPSIFFKYSNKMEMTVFSYFETQPKQQTAKNYEHKLSCIEFLVGKTDYRNLINSFNHFTTLWNDTLQKFCYCKQSHLDATNTKFQDKGLSLKTANKQYFCSWLRVFKTKSNDDNFCARLEL